MLSDPIFLEQQQQCYYKFNAYLEDKLLHLRLALPLLLHLLHLPGLRLLRQESLGGEGKTRPNKSKTQSPGCLVTPVTLLLILPLMLAPG